MSPTKGRTICGGLLFRRSAFAYFILYVRVCYSTHAHKSVKGDFSLFAASYLANFTTSVFPCRAMSVIFANGMFADAPYSMPLHADALRFKRAAARRKGQRTNIRAAKRHFLYGFGLAKAEASSLFSGRETAKVLLPIRMSSRIS